MSVRVKNHIDAIKGGVRLRDQGSTFVKITFFQTLTQCTHGRNTFIHEKLLANI